MPILGIDTATWTASVGVCQDGSILGERSLPTAGSHGFSLLPLIDEALGALGLRVADLRGVAVSIGPGSFTGLRVGLATAKGLAFASGLRLAGVPTMPALARASGVSDGLVCPVLDARKGEVYAALFEMIGGQPIVRHAVVAVALADWLPVVGARACTFVGDGVELIRPHGRPEWVLLPFDRSRGSGGVVALMGEERLRRGESDDVAELEPLYVRPSEAELKHP